MQKSPYLILGVAEDATEQEIKRAYEEKRAQYTEELFSEGQKGMDASRKLSELDIAYSDCMDDVKKRKNVEDFGSEYGIIESLIKAGSLNDAQAALDNIMRRDAEWHYYQAVIYHKKNWFEESKKQLELAVSLDPNEPKYRESLRKLNESINKKNTAQQGGAGGAAGTRGGYQEPSPNDAARQADNCCNLCFTIWCCDCCCECLGFDLCPCC